MGIPAFNTGAGEEQVVRRKYTCRNCGEVGHSRRICPKDLHTVEEILEHRGTLTNMQFLVRWVGTSDETWEPLANLKDDLIFLQYINVHGLHLHL